MPFTRNLYEIDEVRSALQICLRKGLWRAVFWACELVLSDESELAHDTIRDTWLMWGSPHDPTILTTRATDPESWVMLIQRTLTACTFAKYTAHQYLTQNPDKPRKNKGCIRYIEAGEGMTE